MPFELRFICVAVLNDVRSGGLGAWLAAEPEKRPKVQGFRIKTLSDHASTWFLGQSDVDIDALCCGLAV